MGGTNGKLLIFKAESKSCHIPFGGRPNCISDRLRRLRAFRVATLLFVAYVVAPTWVNAVKADMDPSGTVLGRHRMDCVVLLVAFHAVGLSAYLVHLARIR